VLHDGREPSACIANTPLERPWRKVAAMLIGVPREVADGETRVALVPETVAKLVKSGLQVVVETGAGQGASIPDEAYRTAGASIAPDAREVFARSDVVLKIRTPMMNESLGAHEADVVREGAVLVAFLGRDPESEAARKLKARKVTAFSMEMVPRTSRAQKMDALSSLAAIGGYRGSLLGALHLGKFFPLMMTAAGTIAPARVFIFGAGVAGLQAIATSRRIGAVVEATDIRPAVREEVQSLGATFVGAELLDESMVAAGGYAKEQTAEQQARQRQVVAERLKQVDVVICTAAVPGKKAPVLITEDMVKDMKPGAVIVDMAAESGGNCALTEPDAVVVKHGVTILGPTNLPATMPVHASQMYSRNAHALLMNFVKDGQLNLDFSDDINRDTCLVGGAPRAEAAATEKTS
jgi:NAD(P) transhydrogenase subunit alpha